MVTQNHFVIPATVLEKFRYRGFPEGVTLTADHCKLKPVFFCMYHCACRPKQEKKLSEPRTGQKKYLNMIWYLVCIVPCVTCRLYCPDSGLRMSSTFSSTRNYIFDYCGLNIRLFDWVRLGWTTNSSSKCQKGILLANPLDILMSVVMNWNIASSGYFISFTCSELN